MQNKTTTNNVLSWGVTGGIWTVLPRFWKRQWEAGRPSLPNPDPLHNTLPVQTLWLWQDWKGERTSRKQSSSTLPILCSSAWGERLKSLILQPQLFLHLEALYLNANKAVWQLNSLDGGEVHSPLVLLGPLTHLRSSAGYLIIFIHKQPADQKLSVSDNFKINK